MVPVAFSTNVPGPQRVAPVAVGEPGLFTTICGVLFEVHTGASESPLHSTRHLKYKGADTVADSPDALAGGAMLVQGAAPVGEDCH